MMPGLMVDDLVYGTFSVPSYVSDATKTAEFARLNYLKQLGVSNIIFQTALHTRKDHSLGACYLAGCLLNTLNNTLPTPITEGERKCVLLAAALHDVGHGPFSHLWEKFVETYGVHWRHEKASVQQATKILDTIGDVSEKQINLICAMIKGNASEHLPADRQFLASIVSSDVDVDRCDYLQRDAHHVPGIIAPSRPFRQLFDRARVVTVDEKALLAYHWQDYSLVYEMACARQTFHRTCYQDPEVLGAELMMLEVLHEAERAGYHFSRNGKSEPLSNAHCRPELFTFLNDSIVEELADSNHPGLEKAKDIINRLRNGELYHKILCFPVDMQQQVADYNERQGASVVMQGTRVIKSTQEWFRSFNVLYYKPCTDGSVQVLSAEDVHHLSPITPSETTDEVEEYIIYCTSVDPEVQVHAKQYFAKILIGMGNRS